MKFRNREALQLENDVLRVTVVTGGGHVAEIVHKATGSNPLWSPPWPSMEPSEYRPALHPQYGTNEESKLLSGIMGHSLCLDTFGPPGPQQLAAGISVHGEASVARYVGKVAHNRMHLTTLLTYSQLRFSRTISLDENYVLARIHESVENLSSVDRSVAWTQHVSLGPPFLAPGQTRFHIRSERSRTFESPGFDAGGLRRAADFRWPYAPCQNGTVADLGLFGCRSSSFTTHLMDRTLPTAFFVAYSPNADLFFGYEWDRDDFPWLGLWEENRSRTAAPWEGKTIACGMEFGVSPFPETKECMVERGHLFDVPAFRLLRGGECASVNYSVFIGRANEIPRTYAGFTCEVAPGAAPSD